MYLNTKKICVKYVLVFLNIGAYVATKFSQQFSCKITDLF